jgi:predicted branched-subunit amino acid permease
MSTIWRTTDRGLLRDVGALVAAASIIGVSFGAIAVATGLPGWVVIAMSVLVFAGGSQFMAVGMLAAGSPAGAAFGGLLLNARHLPFGFAVADVVGRRWPARLLGAHLMIDESVAFALAQDDPSRRRAAYWLTGGALFLAWNLGTGLGVLLGGAAGDPAALGLDAAFPAGLLALVLPSLRDPAARRVAVVGAAMAVLATPLLPPGLPVLLALLALVAAVRRRGAPPSRAPARAEPDNVAAGTKEGS